MVASLRSHRTALRLPGVPWLRTVLRSVCSPLQPFGPPPFAKRTCDVPCFTGVFVPACASLARYSGAAERFALSSPLHPFGASTTTACFRHWRRPSYAPFSFGKKEAFGRATSYDCATNQKAPLDSKGAHEARALCAEQREVSPVRQGASQASPASEEKRLCRTVECCRRQPTESRVRSSWDCPSGHCLSIVQLWQCVVPRRDWLPRSWGSYIVTGVSIPPSRLTPCHLPFPYGKKEAFGQGNFIR